ncbi:MAG: hypothetical protein MK100_07910 [Phycisphaerales bacterium]|nr:hypothetical protein [Phycisphaerales bacterium]
MSAYQELERYFCDQYHSAANAMARRGRWHDAEMALRQLESLDPTCPRAALLRARMCYRRGEYEMVMEHLGVAESRGADSDLVQSMKDDIVANDWKRLQRIRFIQAILWGRSAHSRPERRLLEQTARSKACHQSQFDLASESNK